MRIVDVLETGPLLVINIGLLLINVIGFAIAAYMVWRATARHTRLVDHDLSSQDRRTLRRAVRLEWALFLCQGIFLLVSLWSLARVLPSAPKEAITFYFGTQVGRSVVSTILALASMLDLRDAKIIAELDRQVGKESPIAEPAGETA